MITVDNKYFEKITGWAEAIVAEREKYFLVHLKILPGNKIEVYVDADEGASIDVLAEMNRRLRKQIDAAALFPDGNFSLDVSSPGLDEPLVKFRQYRKNIGREVDVVLTDGRKKMGVLKAVEAERILLAPKLKEKKGKKQKKIESIKKREPEYFSFDKIKSTKVCISF